MTWWLAIAMLNAVVALAYLAIAWAIGRGLLADGQWRTNPLGVATAFLFLTCAAHHGAHPVHMLLPYVGLEEHTGLQMRSAFDEWHLVFIDLAAAVVGVWYWTLRRRYVSLVQGPRLFEDMRERQRQALELNDQVLQGLVVADMALATGNEQASREAIGETIVRARAIIGELLEGSGGREVQPGDLVRERAADVGLQVEVEEDRA